MTTPTVTAPATMPDWIAPGKTVYHVSNTPRQGLFARPLIVDRVLTRDIVCSDMHGLQVRFRRSAYSPTNDRVRRAEGKGGFDLTITYLVQPGDPIAVKTQAELRRRDLWWAVDSAWEALSRHAAREDQVKIQAVIDALTVYRDHIGAPLALVRVTHCGRDAMIRVIKEIRVTLDTDLRTAKDVAEGQPLQLAPDVAGRLVAALKPHGCTVEVNI